MQRVGLEWLHRLLKNPRRLAWRYLVRGPKFFAYIGRSGAVLRRDAPHATCDAGLHETVTSKHE
jgi:hypothetical protein